MKKNNADVKSPLIDLEVDNTTTGGKQDKLSVQPERLSEESNYCVYWIHTKNHSDNLSQGYIGISCNFKERLRSHKKNKKKTKLTDAIKAYGWNNLQKEILFDNLSLQKALDIERKYRIMPNVGWNIQKGGELGVDKTWYDIPENKLKHSLSTSKNTLTGILKNDSKEKRSKRAILSRINNIDSYKNLNIGSNNGRALLTEKEVKIIKCELIPSGMKLKDIAEKFNIKPYVISFIKSEKNWKQIVCDSPAHK